MNLSLNNQKQHSLQGHELDIPYIEDASENKPFKVGFYFVSKNLFDIWIQIFILISVKDWITILTCIMVNNDIFEKSPQTTKKVML